MPGTQFRVGGQGRQRQRGVTIGNSIEAGLHARVLLVEDTFLVACALKALLRGKGCDVVGPVASLDHTVAVAGVSPIDVALLDVDVLGGWSFPVADILIRRGIPIAFVTGVGRKLVEARYPGRPVISKPVAVREMCETLDLLRDGMVQRYADK